jgi:hypothetical protein
VLPSGDEGKRRYGGVGTAERGSGQSVRCALREKTGARRERSERTLFLIKTSGRLGRLKLGGVFEAGLGVVGLDGNWSGWCILRWKVMSGEGGGRGCWDRCVQWSDLLTCSTEPAQIRASANINKYHHHQQHARPPNQHHHYPLNGKPKTNGHIQSEYDKSQSSTLFPTTTKSKNDTALFVLLTMETQSAIY